MVSIGSISDNQLDLGHVQTSPKAHGNTSTMDFDKAKDAAESVADQTSYQVDPNAYLVAEDIVDTMQGLNINHEDGDHDTTIGNGSTSTPIVDKLRKELESMGLSIKGSKSELKDRLKKGRKRAKQHARALPNVFYETGQLRLICDAKSSTWQQSKGVGTTAKEEEGDQNLNLCESNDIKRHVLL